MFSKWKSLVGALLAGLLLLSAPASAAVLFDIDGGDGTAGGPYNSPVTFDFRFDDFSTAGAITPSGTDLEINVTDTVPGNDTFGGIGFGIDSSVSQFDASLYQLTIDLTVHADHTFAGPMAIIMQDVDPSGRSFAKLSLLHLAI